MFNFNKKRAQKIHAKAQALHDEGSESEAIDLYTKAIKLDPEKAESYYNIGLIYKYRGAWNESLHYNKIANELNPEDESARWNLAIAATALEQWDIARAAWLQHGLALEGDSGPIEMNAGITPVRLNPHDAGEVVWATRIDPVRAVIDSIPFPESGFRHGDIVLHDGAGTGTRKSGDREYSVFNVLKRLQPSAFETALAFIELANETDLDELDKLFADNAHVVEDWTSNVRMLCKQCSEGVPHDHHDEDRADTWNPERRIGIAICNNTDVAPLFAIWEKQTGSRLISFETWKEDPSN